MDFSRPSISSQSGSKKLSLSSLKKQSRITSFITPKLEQDDETSFDRLIASGTKDLKDSKIQS